MNLVLLTRRDGVGINPVGVDTVIYYDSDWNPAMDQQAQDRCPPNKEVDHLHIVLWPFDIHCLKQDVEKQLP